MNRNSNAYHDAWKRARDAIQKELFGYAEPSFDALSARKKKIEYLLDDCAAAAACAVLGIEDDQN